MKCECVTRGVTVWREQEACCMTMSHPVMIHERLKTYVCVLYCFPCTPLMAPWLGELEGSGDIPGNSLESRVSSHSRFRSYRYDLFGKSLCQCTRVIGTPQGPCDTSKHTLQGYPTHHSPQFNSCSHPDPPNMPISSHRRQQIIPV